MASPRVGLLVSCAADLFCPEVGLAAAALIESGGCELRVPAQGCCGQVGYNGGDPRGARRVAERVIAAFDDCEHIVVPSASCAGMLKRHYPRLFDDAGERERAEDFARRTHELSAFLCDVLELPSGMPRHDFSHLAVCWHDSCASLREARCEAPSRRALKALANITPSALDEREVCCGFGGLFSVRFPAISTRMADDALARAERAEPELLLGPDLACLLHLAGRLSRRAPARRLRVMHVALALAGWLDAPGLGEAKR